MTVRILGPLSIQIDDQQVRPGPKQRALLAILAMETGRTVPAFRLVELLWGNSAPRSALTTLRSHVAHLRRVLEPGRDPWATPSTLVTEGAGYALRLPPEQVDAVQFGGLVDAGRRALATDDPGGAVARLRAALALWRGPALGDLAEEPFAIGEARRLEELRRTARRLLVEARLALGRHAEMTGESSRCAALVTSRIQLADLDGAEPLTLELLDLEHAVALLARFAGPERVAEEPAAAKRIAHQCGLLPLALRIVGARLRARPGWPLRAMAARLADTRRRLDELQVGDLAVRSSFLESYRAMPAADARLFRLLGLLEGPDATAGVAAALAGGAVVEAEAILERLASAQLIETPAPGRYRFHDLMRLFAREQAEADEDQPARSAVLKRALRWYLACACAADELLKPAGLQDEAEPDEGAVRFADRAAALAWLEAEVANLVAAARQAADQASAPLAEIACQLLGALRRFLDLCRRWSEWQAVGQAALHAAQSSDNQAAVAVALKELGVVHTLSGRVPEAIDCHEQALAIARRLGDRDIEERVLNNLGLIYAGQHRYADAVRCYRRSLAIFEQLGDEQAKVLNNLGLAYHRQHRHRDAIECFERVLPICRHLGDRWEEAAALWRLGLATEATRGGDAARPLWAQALDIFQDLGAPEATEVRSPLGEQGTGTAREPVR